MKSKTRKKATRYRGTHTHGRGAKKKARGKGHRGGIGKSGSGKRADHKKNLKKIDGKPYFGKSKTLRKEIKIKPEEITLKTIVNNISSLEKKGVAKKTQNGYNLNLKKYRIIGKENLEMKLDIEALSATKGAIESVKSAGGNIVVKEK